MAANGEERLLTLFGDVHYYFSEPTPRPVHHRFDKECYIYLYRDASQRRGRLEIANHAGTPEQDAFTGYLDASKISQSQKHPALVTIVVDGLKGAAPVQASEHHWRLPSTDPRDEGKYLFRLHTLDIYFWTVNDANTFVRSAQQTLNPQQLDIDVPPASTPHHGGAMSPVVQNLENMAISDPAYGHSQQSRSARSSQAQQGGGHSTPGHTQSPAPPPPQASPSVGRQKEQPTSFQPMAYNPAAPAAPEVHAHREKTPPPPEAGAVGGTGLRAAAYNDHVQQHHGSVSSFPPPPGSISQSTPYASPPPQGPPGSTPYASPPPSALTSQRTSHAAAAYTPASPRTASPHGSLTSASDPNAHLYGKPPPLDSPTAEFLGPRGHSGQRQPLQHLQPQYADYLSSRPTSQATSPANSHQNPTSGGPPAGGYGNYDYNQQHHGGQASTQQYYQQNPYGTGDQSIHSQVYRPTEEEARKGRRGSLGGSGKLSNVGGGAGVGGEGKGAGPGQQPGKWEERAGKAEKGLNKFLRKVEKKIG